jgi:hypothetical protein
VVETLDFLASYESRTGISAARPYGLGTTRQQAEQGYGDAACITMSTRFVDLSPQARDDLRFILTRQAML